MKTPEQITREIAALCFVDHDQGRGDEERYWATLDHEAVESIIMQTMQQAREQALEEAAAAAAACLKSEKEKSWVEQRIRGLKNKGA